MKFENPSFKFFFNGRTNTQTDKPKAICFPLFQSWGHKERLLQLKFYQFRQEKRVDFAQSAWTLSRVSVGNVHTFH